MECKGVAQKGDPYMLNRTGQKGAKREFMLYCYTSAGRVFNPVSVGKCLSQLKFGNYWFETGTRATSASGSSADREVSGREIETWRANWAGTVPV